MTQKLKKLSPPEPETYVEYTAKLQAREHTPLAFSELNRILSSKNTFDQQVSDLEDTIREFTTQLKRRKLDGHVVVDRLGKFLNKVQLPSSDADIIRAADLLLQRGWGRPKVESHPLDRFIGMDDKQAREVVRAALIARAVDGDVSAQQAVLRLPSQVEILGIGDDQLDAGNLSDSEMTLFLSLIEKMKQRQSVDESTFEE